MKAPRHLWSGEWLDESAAAKESMARSRVAAGPARDDAAEPALAPGTGERRSFWQLLWTATRRAGSATMAGLRRLRGPDAAPAGAPEPRAAPAPPARPTRAPVAGASIAAPRPAAVATAPEPTTTRMPRSLPLLTPPYRTPGAPAAPPSYRPRVPPAPSPAEARHADPPTAVHERAQPPAAHDGHGRLRVRAFTAALLTVGLIAGAVLIAEAVTSGGGAGPAASTSSSGPPWLGVEMDAQTFGTGALVDLVVPGGPADQAGLEPGDVITAVNGQPISGPSELANALADKKPGDQVQLEFYRAGQSLQASATLGTQPTGGP